MSRTLSPAALQAMFAQETDKDLILLLTIYSPDNPEQVILRLCDSAPNTGSTSDGGFTGRLQDLTTDTQIVYGVVSGGQEYIFFPMNIGLPDEVEGSAPQCTITVYDVTRELMPVVRLLNGRPKVKLQLVLSSSPNTVEATFSNLYITNFTYTVDRITANLSMVNYETEPFPQYSFTPVHFPGLF